MDAREFKQLFMPFHRPLYQVAYRLTGNAQDAEDLLQDTYLRLWQKRNELKGEAATQAYLAMLMRNLFLDQRRRKRIDASADIGDHAEPPDAQSLDRQIDTRDEASQMERLIGQLPEREANIVRKHLVEGRSYEEIGQETGLSQGHIRIIVMRARQKLKQQFQKLTKRWTN